MAIRSSHEAVKNETLFNGDFTQSTEFFKEEKEMIRVRQKYTFLESSYEN